MHADDNENNVDQPMGEEANAYKSSGTRETADVMDEDTSDDEDFFAKLDRQANSGQNTVHEVV